MLFSYRSCVADSLNEWLVAMTNRADIVITSGGVLVGEEDNVRIALELPGRLQLCALR